MTNGLKLNLNNLEGTVTQEQINNLKSMVVAAHETLHSKSGEEVIF